LIETVLGFEENLKKWERLSLRIWVILKKNFRHSYIATK